MHGNEAPKASEGESAAHPAITVQHLLDFSHALLLSLQGGMFDQKLPQSAVSRSGWAASKVRYSIYIAIIASSLQYELHFNCTSSAVQATASAKAGERIAAITKHHGNTAGWLTSRTLHCIALHECRLCPHTPTCLC